MRHPGSRCSIGKSIAASTRSRRSPWPAVSAAGSDTGAVDGGGVVVTVVTGAGAVVTVGSGVGAGTAVAVGAVGEATDACAGPAAADAPEPARVDAASADRSASRIARCTEMPATSTARPSERGGKLPPSRWVNATAVTSNAVALHTVRVVPMLSVSSRPTPVLKVRFHDLSCHLGNGAQQCGLRSRRIGPAIGRRR